MAARARVDTRGWAVKRRERTRQLIELGGLVIKAGIVELVEDDRAVILGILVEAAGRLRGKGAERERELWRRRGRREFSNTAVASNEQDAPSRLPRASDQSCSI